MYFDARRVFSTACVQLVARRLCIFVFFRPTETHTALYYEPFARALNDHCPTPTTNHCSSSARIHRQSFAASSIISSFRAEPSDRLSDLGRQERRSGETPKTHVSAGVSSHPNRANKGKAPRANESTRKTTFEERPDNEYFGMTEVENRRQRLPPLPPPPKRATSLDEGGTLDILKVIASPMPQGITDPEVFSAR